MRSSGLVLGLVLSAGIGHAQFIVIDGATEHTQIFNNLELAFQSAQHIKELADMARNSTKFGSLPYVDISNELYNIQKLAHFGTGLSSRLANEDYRLRAAFPGYQAYQISQQGQTYQQKYAVWSQVLLDTLSGQMRHGGRQHADALDAATTLNNLRLKVMGVGGRLEAAQTAASAGLLVATQMQKLQELMQTDMDSRATYQGMQVQIEAEKVAAAQRFFRFTPLPDTGNPAY